ncbi:MAG TPA: hypothetical protein VF543_22585 [Pyrinomonadaceae bacterium]|jgi:hypothetical protein
MSRDDKARFYVEISQEANDALTQYASSVHRSRKAQAERIIEEIFSQRGQPSLDIAPKVDAVKQEIEGSQRAA